MSYRDDVLRTYVNRGSLDGIRLAMTGLIGETGEVVDWSKKNFFHSKKPEMTSLVLELGDILWYAEVFYYQLEMLNINTFRGIRAEGNIITRKHSNEETFLNTGDWYLSQALRMHEAATRYTDFIVSSIGRNDAWLHYYADMIHVYPLNAVMYHVANIAATTQCSIEVIQDLNIAKLQKRYPSELGKLPVV